MIKKTMIILCLGVLTLWACKEDKKVEKDTSYNKSWDADTSYAFGMAVSLQFKELGFTFDYDAFIQGFRESLEGNKTKFSIDEAIARVNPLYNEALETQAEAFRQEEMAYLAENSKKPGITSTPSGLQYEVITEGTGEKPDESDTVVVHYQGTLIDGIVFDSSYDREKPAEFPLYRVIRGWREGIPLMRVGSVYRFYIPSDLAYGPQGFGDNIPPYATLIFKVELLSIIK